MTATANATQIEMSANERDFHATIEWIKTQKQNGNGEFHLPEGKLYPFLHLEDKYKSGTNIIIKKCFERLKHYKTAYEAMKHIDEWIGIYPPWFVGAGGNHIYFQVQGKIETEDKPATRTAIIYFDPYEI